MRREVKTVKAWMVVGRNSILENQDQQFYVSFNSSPGGGLSIFAGDGGGSETALVKDGSYYILNGDFREQYEAAIDDGWEACVEIFLDNPSFHSSWSNQYDEGES